MSQAKLGAVSLALLLSFLQSCATRSISNTARPWDNSNTTYAGELTDLDVVGADVADGGDATDVQLHKGERVLVVQSGAMFPDEQVLTGLATHFDVGAASGIPSRSTTSAHGMRMAAARGGFGAVIAYWGVLETRQRPNAGEVAAWVPIVGYFVPSESQQMRIRLRIVVLDIRTGHWRCLLPEPMTDDRASSMATRNSADSKQVEVLAEAGYRAAIELLAKQLLQP